MEDIAGVSTKQLAGSFQKDPLRGGQDAFIARIIFPQNLVPAVSLSASNLVFGSQFVGGANSAQTVTLTNNGAALLTILSVTESGDFRQTNTCGPVLVPGANCAISITFNPTLAGARTGAVTITDNAQGTPHIISLSGIGVAPVPQISLSTVTTKPGGAGFTLARHSRTALAQRGYPGVCLHANTAHRNQLPGGLRGQRSAVSENSNWQIAISK